MKLTVVVISSLCLDKIQTKISQKGTEIRECRSLIKGGEAWKNSPIP